MGKYDKCDRIRMKVPVQFGKMSKRERLCYDIGYTGALSVEPYIMSSYYRIHESEPSGGRFFNVYSWRGTKNEKIDKNGKVWQYVYYINYREIPKEIRENLERLEKSEEK